jgi:hypothetical protein
MTEIHYPQDHPTQPEDSQPSPETTGDEVQDNNLSHEVPHDVKLPGDGTLTAQEAFNIHPREQVEARAQIEAGARTSLLDRLKRSRAARIVGAGVVLLTAVGVTAGVTHAMSGDKKNAAPGPQPVATAPAVVPTPEAPSASVTTEQPTPAPTEIVITPENPAMVAGLEAEKNPVVFEGFPLASRTSWVVYRLVDEAEQATNPQAFVETDKKTKAVTPYTLPDGSELSRHLPIANHLDPTSGTELTRSSSPDDVVYYILAMRNLIGSVMENGQYDKVAARKFVSAIYADPDSEAYKNSVDSVEKSNIPTVLKDKDLHKYRDIQGSDHLYSVKLGKESYEAQTIRYSYGGGTVTIEVIFEPKPEMGKTAKGEQRGVWLIKREAQETVKPLAK